MLVFNKKFLPLPPNSVSPQGRGGVYLLVKDVTDVILCMQILAKFVTLREDGNGRSRWVYYIRNSAVSVRPYGRNGAVKKRNVIYLRRGLTALPILREGNARSLHTG